MNRLKQANIVSLFVLLTASAIQAVTHEVYPDSGLTIQATILAASNGDSVIIHDGEYAESVVVYGRGLFIGSGFIRDGDSTHIANTIIHADTTRQDTMSCFIYAYGEHPRSKLCGLTLSNGRGTYSTVTDHIIGGGVYIYDSSIQIESCVIQNCSAFLGGGVAIRGRESHPEIQRIEDCVFTGCSSTGAGGGIQARLCSLVVDACVFENNRCEDWGGGADVTSSFAIFANSTMVACSALSIGGLSYCGNRGAVENCTFIRNTDNGDYAHFEIVDSDATVSGCYFGETPLHTNSVSLSNRDEPLRFFGNVVENCINISGYAGAINFAMHTDGEFAYNVVRNNRGHVGCVLYVMQGSTIEIHHNVIENNISDDPELPSVLFAINEAIPTLDSNIIRNNSGQTMLYHWWQPHVIDARNNWWGHESGPYHPTLNPEGQGDTLYSDMVDFIPWLSAPPDTTMPTNSVDRKRPQVPGMWQIMNLYPNPFNSEFAIVLAGFTRSDFSLRLYDILGREAAVIQEGALTGGRFSFRVPPELASGVYFLRASDRSQVDTRKVIFLK
ncbi:T9SS type A sorting domain-containing protein [bacterium]|nr:T9SS type A sorting domain-containing protein [bacterium]